MKTKTIILTILLVLTTLGVWAQNGKPRLVVKLTDRATGNPTVNQ